MPEKVAILAQALKGLGGMGQGVWRGASHVGGGPVGGALLLGTGAATTAVAAPMAIQNTQNNFRDSMAARNIVPKVAEMTPLHAALIELEKEASTPDETAGARRAAWLGAIPTPLASTIGAEKGHRMTTALGTGLGQAGGAVLGAGALAALGALGGKLHLQGEVGAAERALAHAQGEFGAAGDVLYGKLHPPGHLGGGKATEGLHDLSALPGFHDDPALVQRLEDAQREYRVADNMATHRYDERNNARRAQNVLTEGAGLVGGGLGALGGGSMGGAFGAYAGHHASDKKQASALDTAYLAYSHGKLASADLEQLEDFDAMLKGADWKTHAAQGAAVAGGAAATGLAMAGIAKGINAAVDALTYAGDFKSMMAANPDLAEYPEPEIRMVFASLRHLNPEFSKDPLVAGTFVRGRMENRLQSGSGGFEAPRVELGTAKDLAQGSQFMSQAQGRDPLNEMLQGAGQMGVEHAGRGFQGGELVDRKAGHDAAAKASAGKGGQPQPGPPRTWQPRYP